MSTAPQHAIGRGPLWEATLEDLASRWLDLPANGSIAAEFTPEQIARRVTERVGRVRRYCEVPAAPALDSPRRWETSWRREKMRDAILAALERQGWKVSISGRRNMSAPEIASAFPIGEQTIVLEWWVIEERARRLSEAGLLIPFSADDAMVLMLAEELFLASATRMGNPPAHPWIDELARHLFAKDVLGLPFTPLAAELARTR